MQSSFKPKVRLRERRDRSEEFASFVPRARAPSGSNELTAALRAVSEMPWQLPRLESRTTSAESAYMGRVAALGCVVCMLLGFGRTAAQVHHVRAGVGKAQRAGNYCTVPLCEPHHTGKHGVHGDRGCLRQLNLSELDLLDITIGELFK